MLAVTLHRIFGCQDQWRQAGQRFGQFQEGMLPGRQKHKQSVKDTFKGLFSSRIHVSMELGSRDSAF